MVDGVQPWRNHAEGRDLYPIRDDWQRWGRTTCSRRLSSYGAKIEVASFQPLLVMEEIGKTSLPTFQMLNHKSSMPSPHLPQGMASKMLESIPFYRKEPIHETTRNRGNLPDLR
jgi:hypothetical protein